jgi:anti-sigma regulatory factor (Ser/Thr protein kinase)
MRVRLAPLPTSPAAARSWVDAALSQSGFGGDRSSILLMVTEIATNCVVHARTDFEIDLAVNPAGVTCAVRDFDGTQYPTVSPEPAAGHGLGLLLVEQLSDRWGCRQDPSGKTVWFTVHTRPHP